MRILLLILATSICHAAWAKDAPEFTLDAGQGTVSLTQLKGKLVYLDFWASWCTPCKKSFPWMNAMQKKYGKKGLHVLGVNLDRDKKNALAFLSKVKADFQIAYDPEGKTADSYKVMGMPSAYLISRDGKIISTHIGFREKSKAKLEHAIHTAL